MYVSSFPGEEFKPETPGVPESDSEVSSKLLKIMIWCCMVHTEVGLVDGTVNVTKQNSLRYPIPVPLLHHHTSAIITDCNRSTTLFPWLDLPGFLPGTETKPQVWLLRSGFCIARGNKLVSLTGVLGALRSFRSFTLHYITLDLHICLYQLAFKKFLSAKRAVN